MTLLRLILCLLAMAAPPDLTGVLEGYYRDASAQLREIVLKPGGRTAASEQFRRARATELQARIEAIRDRLKLASAAWAGRAVIDAASRGASDAVRQARVAGVRDVGGRPLDGSFAVIDEGTVRAFALDTVRDLHKGADALAASAGLALRRTAQEAIGEAEINRILAGGVIQGKPVETIRELRDALRAVAGDRIEIPTRSGGTMSFEVGYYAGMVARTKTRQAVEASRHERLASLGIDLVSVIGRVSNNFCTAFLGQVFSISGAHPRYPALATLPGGGPPFHPNCSKSTRAVVEGLSTPEQMAVGEGLSDAARLRGLTPAAAQRAYQDLQLRGQAAQNYRTIVPMAGPKSAAGPGDFITDREATQKLKPLGVAKSQVGRHEKLGDVVIPMIEEAVQLTKVAPVSVVIDDAVFRSAGKTTSPANFDPNLRQMRINPNSPYWADTAGEARRNYKTKFWSSPSHLHPILHELGHAAFLDKVGMPDYLATRKMIFTAAETKDVAKMVSKAASASPIEFIAEVFAAKAAGEKIPVAMRVLYARLEGP